MKLNTDLSIFSRIGFVEKLLFTKHLSIMVKSGIPIAEAIDAIADQTGNLAFKKILINIKKEIENGQSLEKSLSLYPHIFDPLYLNLIKIAEESGGLEQNLNYLADELKKQYAFKKKIQGALFYPMIVISTATIVGGFTTFYVLPKLIDLFSSLDVKLPLSTKILLFIAQTAKDYGIFIALGMIILSVGIFFLIRLPKVKPRYHKFLLKLPVFGIFIRNIELTNFCRNIGIMLKSGLPITAALKTEYDATSNLVFKEYIGQIAKAVEKGKSLESEMNSSKYPLIPKIMSKMIGVGEKTGKLDESLIYLGDFFEDEVDNSAKNLANVLEPIMLLVIGLIVAFVAISIISPIYQLTGGIRK